MTFTPTHGGVPIRVHRSRILRFDGIRPPTKSGFTTYDQDFGVSNLIPVMLSVLEDQLLAGGVSHMSQEASIPILNVNGIREIFAGNREPGELTPDQIGEQVNQMKSIYRLLLLDSKSREEFTREAVNFGGLADLMDKYPARIAAAAKIPRTRFLGSPPIGMSATGESDMRNYVMMMEAMRVQQLEHPLSILDEVLARDAGLRLAPEYQWNSLLEMTDAEIAEAAKIKTEALSQALVDQVIDEDEYRETLSGDPLFGDLPGDPPEPDPMPMPGDPPIPEPIDEDD